jgi:hypothetical protein
MGTKLHNTGIIVSGEKNNNKATLLLLLRYHSTLPCSCGINGKMVVSDFNQVLRYLETNYTSFTLLLLSRNIMKL